MWGYIDYRCEPDNHKFEWSSNSAGDPCPDWVKCKCNLYTYGEYKKFMMHPADPRKHEKKEDQNG